MEGMRADAWRLSIVEAVSLIARGELSATELVASTLGRLEAVEPLIHAFVSVDGERALRDARACDGHRQGALRGIPAGVKDIFDVAGRPTRCGSEAMAGVAPAVGDAGAVARLRGAGAVVLGKTTTHELACGVYTPPTRNPWDLAASPGGSSGGSGAAVAAGAVLGAIGSDTGGSIRIPAAHCGLVGLKPTYGRIGRTGALALSWSLDHVGTLTRTVEDAALMLAVLAGPDPADPTTLHRPPLPDPLLPADATVRGVRVGALRGGPFAPVSPAMSRALELALARLEAEGVTVEEVEVPELEHCLVAEFGIVAAEAASYHEQRMRDAPELIGEGVRGLLETGLLMPASAYLRAQRARRLIQEAFRSLFDARRLDVVVAPTVPAGPQGADQAEYRIDGAPESVIDALVRTTAPFNLTGMPAVAVPVNGSGSRPPGSVQVAARPFDDATALRVALAIQRAGGPLEEPAALAAALSA